ATDDDQIAVFLALPDVAGVKPAVYERFGGFLGMLKIAGGNVFAAHQDFTIFGDLHFDTTDGRADGSLAGMERVIQRHDGSGLGETVALDHQEAELGKE